MAAKTMNVYTIVERLDKGSRVYWLKIGIAFPNRDGSINVYLDALPANGRLHIRDLGKKPEGEEL